MPERSCPRCHTPLTHEDSGVLFYCSHCGAPQVQLSEELREQAAEASVAQISSREHGAIAGNFAEAGLPSLDTADPTAVDWTEAVRAAGLGGLIALGLGLISMPVPPVFLLALLWALIAPIVVLGIYCSRSKHTHIRPGFGARLGLITGLAVALAISTVVSLQFILERFVFHHGTEIDNALAGMFTKLQESQAANQQPMPFNVAIPEFRVGLLLSTIGVFISFYLLYTLISGAFGGLLRSRSRTA